MRSLGFLRKYRQKKYVLISVFVIGFTSIYASMSKTLRETYIKKYDSQENCFNGYNDQNVHLQNSTRQINYETTEYFKSDTVNSSRIAIKSFNGLDSKFDYPLNIDMVKLVEDVKKEGKVFYKPINVYKYKLIKNCESKCKLKSNASKILLFAIKSATGNLEQRSTIRETWGNETVMGEFIIKRVFVLGVSNPNLKKSIINEWKKYDDLIQYNFNDYYFNNTLKTIGTFNWIVSHCQQASFVLFSDDDYFVSPFNLVQYLKQLPNSKIRKLYTGNTKFHSLPFRNPRNKWYVSRLEYPFSSYPPFINAGSFVMSMDTIKDMQIAIQYTQLFRLDDIFLAIVAFKLNIKLTENKQFYDKKITIRNDMRKIITSHGFKNPTEIKRTWDAYKGIVKKSP